MGRIPRWPRLAVARGMNKGNCSFFARSARFSSGRGRISIYFETSSNSLRSQITFRPPRSIPFSSTKPANFTIESTNFNPSTDNSQKFFITWLLALFQSSLHFADSLQNSSSSRKIHVARWRSTTRRPTIGPTDPANGRRAPSRCRPPCLDPYTADVHLDMVASLEYALLLQYLSPLDSAGSSVSLLPGPSGRSSRRLVLLRRRAHPQTASQTASPRSLAIPLDPSPPPRSTAASSQTHRASVPRHTAWPSVAASRLRRPPRMPPRPLAAPPGHFSSVPPTHDFQFPSHLPRP